MYQTCSATNFMINDQKYSVPFVATPSIELFHGPSKFQNLVGLEEHKGRNL